MKKKKRKLSLSLDDREEDASMTVLFKPLRNIRAIIKHTKISRARFIHLTIDNPDLFIIHLCSYESTFFLCSSCCLERTTGCSSNCVYFKWKTLKKVQRFCFHLAPSLSYLVQKIMVMAIIHPVIGSPCTMYLRPCLRERESGFLETRAA